MDVQQRFLKRKFLTENIDLFLRESKYHRDHDEAEELDGITIWHWDDVEGSNDSPLGF